SLVEVVAGIESAVAQKLECRAVKLIGAGRSNDADLRAVALAVFGAVGIGDDIKFTDRIYTQKLATRSSRSDIDERCPRILNAIEQKKIFLRSAALHREHIAH